MKPLVQNAADEEQVKDARAKEKRDARRLVDDWRVIVAQPSGRRVLASLLAECRVSASVWSPSAMIHRDAGRQEIGHLILRRIVEADRKIGAEMLTEAYEKEMEGELNV